MCRYTRTRPIYIQNPYATQESHPGDKIFELKELIAGCGFFCVGWCFAWPPFLDLGLMSTRNNVTTGCCNRVFGGIFVSCAVIPYMCFDGYVHAFVWRVYSCTATFLRGFVHVYHDFRRKRLPTFFFSSSLAEQATRGALGRAFRNSLP